MKMYVNYFRRHVKTRTEKPTVGILLCTENSKDLVEITLPNGANCIRGSIRCIFRGRKS